MTPITTSLPAHHEPAHPAWHAVRSGAVLVVALGLTTGVLLALSSVVSSGA